MQFTNEELAILNAYLNGVEGLPVEVEAINVKLREHFNQDNSAPEVVVPEETETPAEAPVEPVDEPEAI